MRRVRIISSVLLAFLVAASSTIFWAQTHQPPDQPYHQTDMSGAGNSSSTRAARPLHPVAAHSTFKGVALSRLEVLPTSISITGPRYTQRMVVEATFADGSQ
ncbi:MAG TPA: hypothetical protein VK395_17065, partial [Gemmataceae bacterium]|nr:hypothetical protein [Gemmataceae bacterium]